MEEREEMEEEEEEEEGGDGGKGGDGVESQTDSWRSRDLRRGSPASQLQ